MIKHRISTAGIASLLIVRGQTPMHTNFTVSLIMDNGLYGSPEDKKWQARIPLKFISTDWLQ